MFCLSRIRLIVLIVSAMLALPSIALEEREFLSADGSKSFRATLVDYEEGKELVTVEMDSGKTMRFAMDLLSKKDQEYVKKHADILKISRSFEVRFKEFKGDTTRTKEGLVRSSTTPTGYEIEVYNRSKKIIEDVTVRYHFYYCVGSSSAEGPRHTPKVLKGEMSFPKMYDQYTETRRTAQVDLIRESKKGVAPPVPVGGRGGWCNYVYPGGRQGGQQVMLCSTDGVQEGYRRIDHVIGIVAEVCVHGKVVKTVADAPFMLKKHKEGIKGIN